MWLDWYTVGLNLKIPLATYRVQLNSSFGFRDLKSILPYLCELGISHIYASPIFKAKKGSTHGYDIVDPNSINPELGGAAGFEELMGKAKARGLGWLQDIVPNHASYSLENRLVWDMLMKGSTSRYSDFFDVDWNHPSPKLKGKVLLPFLSQPYRQALKSRNLSLRYSDGYKISYNGIEFPVSTETARDLLNSDLQIIEQYNRNPECLNRLLSNQHYTLTYWKTALKHINYRRFFDIIDLIGVRQENSVTFKKSHRLIFELAKSGRFDGLRVDHIDGLYNPQEYLARLRQQLPNAYLVVEKILNSDEQLSGLWPVEGTTGYDFINFVNKFFVDCSGESALDSFYQDFTSNTQAFNDLLYESKKTVIHDYFLGDMRNLAQLLSRALRRIGYTKPYLRENLVRATTELLACFPVYRPYLSPTQFDVDPFRIALKEANQRAPQFTEEFSAITSLLDQSEASTEALRPLMRLQQFTGAIMAKGFEDTALYRYSRLISLNEVGSNPEQYGISSAQFHEFNRIRQHRTPLTLNATSTHDTKRGEDVRARLNILSEIPQEFQSNIETWARLNADKKQHVRGELAPNRNEEYYLYQTLLGTFPWSTAEKADFSNRIKLHMVKALREAKVNSNWLAPNKPYEEAVMSFIEAVLDSPQFLDAFLPLQKQIAYYGAFNSIAQTLLKITCPGIPDFYQGAELWDLNLVDPDNRRPVNYQTRQKLLSEIVNLELTKTAGLLEDMADAKAKLYVIYRALQVRRRFKQLFEEGAYVPLTANGKYSENVVAFCRKKGDCFAIAVAVRFPTILMSNCVAWGSVDWADTQIILPEAAPSNWTDAFTSNKVHSDSSLLLVRDVLSRFPVALLTVGDGNA